MGSHSACAAWVGLMSGVLLSGAASQASAQNPIFRIISSPSPTTGGNTLNAFAAVSGSEAWAVGFQNDNQLKRSPDPNRALGRCSLNGAAEPMGDRGETELGNDHVEAREPRRVFPASRRRSTVHILTDLKVGKVEPFEAAAVRQ